jgi:LuxR family transcriptional regulator, maltose regulon positive regulatory protein
VFDHAPYTLHVAIVRRTELTNGFMSTGIDHHDLMRTKFHRPRVTADLVDRPRLTEALNNSLDRPLILIAAPAGFGKSTLLAAWLETIELPHAWLSLDESDNDLGVFLAYFLAAVQTIATDALGETRAFVSGVNLPAVDLIARSLVNALDRLKRDFVLVLDDYHIIHEQPIHELLSLLLQHPPKGLHLVVTTRQDPPLPLRALRARNQVFEIRGQDLRFSVPEVAAFLERTLGAPLVGDAVAVLAEKTEGWAAGLRLATLTLRYSGEIDGQIARLHAENTFVMDYLINEVQSHVPPAIQSFLLKTAILDRLCAPLCSAVIGPDGADCQPQICLEWLEQSGMFTSALDTQRQWYRYHHLFQALLRARLMRQSSADEVAALHLRASAWFAANGSIEEALRHALAGQDTAAAVRLVAQHRHALMNDEQWLLLNRWLRLFPAETVAAHPDLLLLSAWITDVARLDAEYVINALDRAERLITQMSDQPEHARHLKGEIDALRSKTDHQLATDTDAQIAQTQRALENTPRQCYLVRSVAWLHLALAHQKSGRLDLAYATLATGRQEDTAEDGVVRGRILGMNCYVQWIAGDLPAMLQTAADFLEVVRPPHLSQSLAWAHHFLSGAYYQRNDLAAAETHALASLELRYAGNARPCLYSAFIRALIHQARGAPGQARDAVAWAISYLRETSCESLLPLAEAFRAELAVMQGDLGAANFWASTVNFHVPLSIMALFYAPQLTSLKILLAQDTPASRQQAAEALARLYDFVTATHNTRFTIEVLALQALLQDAQGNERAALALLEQAVSLAEPGGFIRLFADLGLRMAHLLVRLRQIGIAPGYTDRILQAFGESAPAAPSQRAAGSAAISPKGQMVLIEPLTDREREVLALLAQRLSNKEIAQALAVSPQTVKRHATNLYQKLQVGGRREAVAKATRLGLL